MSEEQLDRRELLEQAMEEAENEQEPVETEALLEADIPEKPIETEIGNKDSQAPSENVSAAEYSQSNEEPQEKPITRPSTWKK